MPYFEQHGERVPKRGWRILSWDIVALHPGDDTWRMCCLMHPAEPGRVQRSWRASELGRMNYARTVAGIWLADWTCACGWAPKASVDQACMDIGVDPVVERVARSINPLDESGYLDTMIGSVVRYAEAVWAKQDAGASWRRKG